MLPEARDLSAAVSGPSDSGPSGDDLPDLRTPIPGPRSRELTARLEKRENPAFARRRGARTALSGEAFAPIVLARGLGSNLWDVDENRFVDLAAGFGSVLLGHGSTPVLLAAHAQLDVLAQGLGDLYASEVKVELIERLARLHPDPGARVLLCQSGSDAVTAALKTAALATGRPGIIVLERGYHGLGYAPLAACGFKESYRAPFEAQLNPHVRFVPFPSNEETSAHALELARRAFAEHEIGALLVEPISGRGGLLFPHPDALSALASLAREHGAVVIADEIWTGLGRSGHMLYSSTQRLDPDLICLGKGLGGSIGISTCVGSERTMGAWASDGEVVHTSTHAGHPLACRAALATLDELDRSKLVERSLTLGRDFVAELTRVLGDLPFVKAVRGAGLMVGVELESGARGLAAMKGLLSRGFVATSGGVAGEVVIFTPPLTVAPAQLAASAVALAAVLGEKRP